MPFVFRSLPILSPLMLLCVSCICIVCMGGNCIGSTDPASAQQCYESEGFTVATGITQTIRLGKWVPVTITSKRSQKITQVNIRTRDGADVPVTYEFKQKPPSVGDSIQVAVRFGRKCKSYQITIVTDDGATAKLNVPLTSTQFLRSVQPLILAIESDSQITHAVNDDQSQQFTDDSRAIAKQVIDLSQLPESWLAYDSVDTIFLTTNDTELLAKFCLLYTSPSPRDLSTSRMPSSA